MTAKKKPEDKKKPGRKTLYKPEYKEQVYKLCLLGAIDTQIADFFEISERILNYWKKRYPTFMQSIKRGKLHADAQIAHALFQRARGYVCSETKVFFRDGEIITFERFKHYPPDTVACIFWLKNRAGLLWKDKHDHKMGVSEELTSLLDIVDGSSKGRLPDRSEEYDARQ